MDVLCYCGCCSSNLVVGEKATIRWEHTWFFRYCLNIYKLWLLDIRGCLKNMLNASLQNSDAKLECFNAVNSLESKKLFIELSEMPPTDTAIFTRSRYSFNHNRKWFSGDEDGTMFLGQLTVIGNYAEYFINSYIHFYLYFLPCHLSRFSF